MRNLYNSHAGNSRAAVCLQSCRAAHQGQRIVPVESGTSNDTMLNEDTFQLPTLVAGDLVYGIVEYRKCSEKYKCDPTRSPRPGNLPTHP